jgi:hypothetical protein
MPNIERIRQRILWITLFVILFTFNSTAQGNWSLVKEEEGIKIYTKPESGSEYDAFKAEMQINCKINDIVEVLKNTKNINNWVANCKIIKLLKTEGNDQYYYIETILPWPFDNRDMIYHFQYKEINSKQVRINITGKPDYIKPKEGIVRMLKTNGYWLLTSIDTNKTVVTYQMHVEPGGFIPSWLANSFIANTPLSTFKGLRTIVLKSK